MKGGVGWRVARAWRVVGRTFGRWVAPGLALCWLGFLRVVGAVGMGLDLLIWPSLRRGRATAPVVIVGNPRSGTTFLHRFLDQAGVGGATPLIRLIVPSLALHRLLEPLMPLLERVSPARFHASAAHKTSLASAETDDVALVFRHLDGFFLYGFLLAFDEEEHRDLFDPAHRDTLARDARWWEQIWRRTALHAPQGRVLAKLFSLGPRAPGFFERFPDARLIYLVRDPVETLPSGMSLVTGVLDAALGFWGLPEPTRRRHLDRLYRGLLDLLSRWDADWQSGQIPRDRVLVVRYDRMMCDLEGVCDELFAFLGHTPDETLRALVRETAARQRSYRSGHRYDLARFGLSEAQVRRDAAFVYERWLVDGAPAPGPRVNDSPCAPAPGPTS